MHIAIAACYDKFNYGSMLQAFATQKTILDLGCQVVMLNKEGLGNEIARGRKSYYRENLLNFQMYKAKLGFVGHRVRQKIDRDFKKYIKSRHAEFEVFSKDSFKLSPIFNSFAELSEFCKDFDAVVVGSDQLWLPVNIAGDYYTLSFVNSPTRKISYATSFGVSSLPTNYENKTKNFLSDFFAISLRETSGAKIVHDLIGIDAPVVCDPTMLLEMSQWNAILDEDYVVTEEPYIFCYFLGSNIWNRKCAERLSEDTGYKIIAIAHLDEYVKYDNFYADYQPYDVGPSQWLSLIKGASYVFTDSFHGSIFAAIFNVPFFTFRRHEGMGSQSTNSRLDTLLKRMDLENRLCETPEEFENIMDEVVDFDQVNENIVEYRAESRKWLFDALEGLPSGCN